MEVHTKLLRPRSKQPLTSVPGKLAKLGFLFNSLMIWVSRLSDGLNKKHLCVLTELPFVWPKHWQICDIYGVVEQVTFEEIRARIVCIGK